MTIFTWNYVAITLTVLAVFLVLGKRARIMFVAAVSLAFVIFQSAPTWQWKIKFVLITLGLLIAGWVFGLLIHKIKSTTTRKWLLAAGILTALSPLIYYRYIFGELAVNRVFLQITEKMGTDLGTILAPLGISYFTFRIICYMVEIYRENTKPIRVSEYIAYVAWFPTMLAGPIERVVPFTEQITSDKKVNSTDVAEGLTRICIGLFKKLVLGAFFYSLIDPLLSMPTNDKMFLLELDKFARWQLWFSFYCNFLYIYLDFSGYSDIAIGTSRLFGIRIMENFNYPILATNISDFWQRFHISLTSWIRDYIYFPLGGSRKGHFWAIFNTILMMVLVGIWHGAARHYFWFGIYMGSCLVIFRYWKRFKTRKFPDRVPQWWGKLIGWALTMTCYALGLVIFSFSSKKALLIYAKMFGLM